jgi:hypothetical protein
MYAEYVNTAEVNGSSHLAVTAYNGAAAHV